MTAILFVIESWTKKWLRFLTRVSVSTKNTIIYTTELLLLLYFFIIFTCPLIDWWNDKSNRVIYLHDMVLLFPHGTKRRVGEFANWQKYFRNQINSLAITSNRLSDQVGGDIISNFRNVERNILQSRKCRRVARRWTLHFLRWSR